MKKAFFIVISILFIIVIAIGVFVVKPRAVHREQAIINKTQGQNRLLLTIKSVGGLCSEGPCGSIVSIYQNSAYTIENSDKSKIDGVVSKEQITNLATVIQNTDFNLIKAKKFIGLCPTANDGQELIYTFYPQHEVLSTCVYELDSKTPLFQTIYQVLAEIYSQLPNE